MSNAITQSSNGDAMSFLSSKVGVLDYGFWAQLEVWIKERFQDISHDPEATTNARNHLKCISKPQQRQIYEVIFAMQSPT